MLPLNWKKNIYVRFAKKVLPGQGFEPWHLSIMVIKKKQLKTIALDHSATLVSALLSPYYPL